MSKFLSLFTRSSSENSTYARMSEISRSESAQSVAIRILLAQSRLMSMR